MFDVVRTACVCSFGVLDRVGTGRRLGDGIACMI